MTQRLPDAAWTRRADLAGLVAALGAGNARYVGGAVRDTLLGLAVTDIDLATPLTPDAVIARADAAGIRTVPTGIAHGTLTAVLPGGPVEITTLRCDLSTDGRHAEVAFQGDWHADAARRDFTINALYADPESHEITDYFGGLDDLAARRLRFIGDAHARIREDHLRILRYFRFQAGFGSLPADREAEAACAALAPMLKALSRERIASEILKLLGLPDPAPTVARMAALAVLDVILPEADPAPLAALIAHEHSEHAAPDALRRLGAMLPADPVLVDQVAARLRLANAAKKRLAAIAARPRAGEEQEARALAYRLGAEAARDRLLIAGRSLAPLAGWTAPRFPLKGGDVVAAGIRAGPMVAHILQGVEARWIAEGFPPEARVRTLFEAALAGAGKG